MIQVLVSLYRNQGSTFTVGHSSNVICLGFIVVVVNISFYMPVYLCICICLTSMEVPVETRRRGWIPWNWDFRCPVNHLIWVLGTEPGARAASALSH